MTNDCEREQPMALEIYLQKFPGKLPQTWLMERGLAQPADGDFPHLAGWHNGQPVYRGTQAEWRSYFQKGNQ